MGRLTENSVLNVKNKSHAVTAEITVPEGTVPSGVLIAQGGAFGEWAVYVKDGRPAYIRSHNLFGVQRFTVYGDRTIPAGTDQVRLEFPYDGGGLAKGGTATLYIDDDPVGTGRVEATIPLIFSTAPTSAQTRRHTSATTTAPRTAASRSASDGSRSISARTLRTPTT